MITMKEENIKFIKTAYNFEKDRRNRWTRDL